MIIVFILLLTVLSMALRLASMSVMSYKKIADRKAQIEQKDAETGKEGSEINPENNWNIKSKAAGTAARALKGAHLVVSTFRNILVIVAPIIAIITLLSMLFMVVASSGFMTLFTTLDENGNLTMNTTGLVSSNQYSNNGSNGDDDREPGTSLVGDGESRVLLIGDSRTVGLAAYILGMDISEDQAVIGETSDGDYIYAKGSMGLAWMKEQESGIDAQVTSNTAVVINMGTNDAYSHATTADQYVEWINAKAEEWEDKGATVWFMNTGPVTDDGTSGLKTEHVVAFNEAVKNGLNDNIGYIDEYQELINYGEVVYDDFGVHYDSASYQVVWDLVVNTVKSNVEVGTHTLSFTDNSGRYTDENKTLGYHLYIPNGATTNMPLIVFLHGSGELGDLDAVKNYGMMYSAKQIYGDDFPFIGLQPSCPNYGWGDKPLKELIDYIVDEYDIDEDRIILTGHSMGAVGVWSYGASYGDFFSCAVPISWSSGALSQDGIKNLAKIPIKAYYGTEEKDLDSGNLVQNMQSTVNRVYNAGGDIELIALEGYTHSMTKDQTYTEELFEWMLDQ